MIKLSIILKSTLGTLRDLPMNSPNSAENRTLSPQDNNLDIPVIILVITASKTGQKRPKQLTGLPVEVYIFSIKNKINPQIIRTGKGK